MKTRLALIASLCAAKACASVSAPETYHAPKGHQMEFLHPIPSRCRGSLVNRANRDSATLSRAEREQVAQDLASARAERERLYPVNFILINS